MNSPSNYLNLFIEACKSLQDSQESPMTPKIEEKQSLLHFSSEIILPSLQDNKSSSEITKLDLTQEDLIRFGKGAAKKYWNQKEDRILVTLTQKLDCNWQLIAEKLPGRNKKMCYSRYQRILLDAKDVWKPNEDKEIKRLYEKEKLSWRQISFYFPNRTAKQLREHYIGYLRPNINTNEWRMEEDLQLIELFNIYGKKWKFFENHFEGRTENQLKNRYYGRLEKLHYRKLNEGASGK